MKLFISRYKTICVFRLIAIFVVCVLGASSSSAATYYFSTSGADANNGLSSATPKKTIAAAVTLMTGGNQILFKRGDIWYIPMDSMNLVGHSNFTLNMYGSSGAKPVIAGMVLVPQGSWIHNGGGVWRATIPSNRTFRVFVNGTSYINVADEIGNTGSIASVDAPGEYWFTGTTLYVYTGSTSTPPQNVEVIPGINGNNTQYGYPVLKMKNTSSVVIRNIEFRGGSKRAVIVINAPCNGIIFDTCIISRACNSGMTIGNYEKTMDYVNYIYVTNCIIDKGWTLLENNVKGTIPEEIAKFINGDGISLAHGVEGGQIRANTILNWGHSAIDLVAYSHPTNIWGVHNITVSRNNVYAGNSSYMHGIEVAGIAGKNTNNVIKRNYFHDYNISCHLGGSNNYYFSNIFDGVKLLQPNMKNQPWGADQFAYNTTDGLNAYLEYRNNWIVNNTFLNTDGYNLGIGSYNDEDTNVTGNRIHNNIFMNWNQFTAPPGEHGDVGLLVDPSVLTGLYYVTHNNFWNVANPTGNVSNIEGIKYTAAGLNTAPACAGNCSQNTQLDPAFGAFYSLVAASPAALKTGGINLTGFMPAPFDDYWGHLWRSVGPSRGAIQRN